MKSHIAVLDRIRPPYHECSREQVMFIIPNQEDPDRMIKRDHVDQTKKMSREGSLLAAPLSPEPDTNKNG